MGWKKIYGALESDREMTFWEPTGHPAGRGLPCYLIRTAALWVSFDLRPNTYPDFI